MSSDPADVVRGVGGLIVDRVRLGWQVTTLVPTSATHRPLVVLGTDVADLATPTDDREFRTALVVAAALYAGNRAVRTEVDDALAANDVEVLVWGPELDAEQGCRSASYRPSRAAMAFKGHAMLAAGLTPQDAEPIEVFRARCARHVIGRELDVAEAG